MRALVVAAQRRLLRLRLAPLGSREHVLGWTVAWSTDSTVVLAAASPYLTAHIHGSRAAPDRVVVTTYLRYERPAGRLLWLVVGPMHRLAARYLLTRAAARR